MINRDSIKKTILLALTIFLFVLNGFFDFYQSTYYQHLLLKSMHSPYRFFSMFSKIILKKNQNLAMLHDYIINIHKRYKENGMLTHEQAYFLYQLYNMRPFNVKNIKSWDYLLQIFDVIPVDLLLTYAKFNLAHYPNLINATMNPFIIQCPKYACNPASAYYINMDSIQDVLNYDNLTPAINMFIEIVNEMYLFHEFQRQRFKLRQHNKPITSLALVNTWPGLSFQPQGYQNALKESIMKHTNEKN